MRKPVAMPRKRKIAQLSLELRTDTSSAAGELIVHVTWAESCAVCLPIWLTSRREDFGQRRVITQDRSGAVIDRITPTLLNFASAAQDAAGALPERFYAARDVRQQAQGAQGQQMQGQPSGYRRSAASHVQASFPAPPGKYRRTQALAPDT